MPTLPFPPGRGLGEERRAFPELTAGAKAQGHPRAGHFQQTAEELSVAGARGCFGGAGRDKLFRENNQAVGAAGRSLYFVRLVVRATSQFTS